MHFVFLSLTNLHFYINFLLQYEQNYVSASSPFHSPEPFHISADFDIFCSPFTSEKSADYCEISKVGGGSKFTFTFPCHWFF
jgi:hypothetical protein